jgi:hypothetical protein
MSSSESSSWSTSESSSESFSEPASVTPPPPPVSSPSFDYNDHWLPFEHEFERVNLRLIELIEKAKKYLGDDVFSASEYVQLDNALPVMNAQTDEQVVEDVKKAWQRKQALKEAALRLRKQEAMNKSNNQQGEIDSSPVVSHLVSGSFENASSNTIDLGDLEPVLRQMIKETVNAERKEKSKVKVPSNQRTLDFFFRKDMKTEKMGKKKD